MSVREEIIHIIEKKSAYPLTVTEKTNLYGDVKMNSFCFIKLLLELEEQYQITFGLAEMESCLIVGRLIDTVESKVRKKGGA